MTDRRDDENDDEQGEPADAPARTKPEGVRILGAEEAQAAMDAGTVGRRLGDQDTRYGDVPPRPDPALRPSARFPLARDEQVPDVVARNTPAPHEPEEDFERGISLLDDLEPAEAEETPLTGIGNDETDESVEPVEPEAVEDSELDIISIDVTDDDDDFELEVVEIRDSLDDGLIDDGTIDDDDLGSDLGESGEDEVLVGGAEGTAATLPHWSEPPTGEIPQLLPEAEPVDLTGEETMDAYTAAASTASGPRFLTGVGDWAQEDVENFDVLGDDTTNVGALASAPEDDDTAFDREVAARRKIRTRPESSGGRVGAPPRRTARASGPPEDDLVMAAPPPDMTTRVITGVGIAVLALICLKLGRDATTVLATAIVGLASLELFQGLQRRGFRPATILAVLASIAIVPIAFTRGEFAYPFTFAIVMVFTLLWYLFEVVKTRPTVNVAVTVMGFAYVGGLGGFAGLLLSYQNGVGLIIGVVLCVVSYDIVGYVVGSQFGKRRLAPGISPNKTIEGLVAGMVGSIFVAAVIVNRITPWNEMSDALALGLTVAIMAPLGDLCESMIKRDLGVKDFGSLLPGHGGILDRFDAILFCLPAVYYLARALTIG